MEWEVMKKMREIMKSEWEKKKVMGKESSH
jgi:hypothetical protein